MTLLLRTWELKIAVILAAILDLIENYVLVVLQKGNMFYAWGLEICFD